MRTSDSKIVTLERAAQVAAEARAAGHRVVLANGCFDLLHVGHRRYLEGAAAVIDQRQGDVLMVGINGDDSVRRLKGKGQPLLGARDRARLVAALRATDYVVIFEGDNVRHLIAAIRPHFHAKGTDYTAESVPEREAVLASGGEVVIVGDPKDHNTRDLIRHIRECG
jgi:rfaE bifunctional protein nucleotidyltransferase chain/domain